MLKTSTLIQQGTRNNNNKTRTPPPQKKKNRKITKTSQKTCYVRTNNTATLRKLLVCPPMCPFAFQLRFWFSKKNGPTSPTYGKT